MTTTKTRIEDHIRTAANVPTLRASGEKVIPTEYLHLTVHLIDGGKQEFLQSQPRAASAILSQIRPDRLFAQRQLVVAGADSVTVLPTECIERIDLRADPLPDWQQSEPSIASVTQITPRAFEKIRRQELPQSEKVMGRPMPPPPPQEIGMLVELRSGAMVYLSVRPCEITRENREMTPNTSDDMRLFLSHLSLRPVLFGGCDIGRAIFLLNPANAVRFTLTPTPASFAAGAWPMQILPTQAGPDRE